MSAKQYLYSILTTALTINSLLIGFLIGTYTSKHEPGQKYIVSASSSVKGLHETEKTAISSLAKEIWHRDDIEKFRCIYSGDKPTCISMVEGKPMEVAIDETVREKLLEKTKPLWSTEGMLTLAYIDCALGESAKCQIFGSIERTASELDVGQCIAALKKG